MKKLDGNRYNIIIVKLIFEIQFKTFLLILNSEFLEEKLIILKILC